MNENGNPGFDMIEMSLDRPKEEPSTEAESLEAVQEIAAEPDDGAAATEITEEEAAEPAPAEEDPLSIGEAALYMLKGMVGIFLVTGLIILVLVIMDKAGNRKKETEE